MKREIFKLVIPAMLLSLFLAGCTSTDTTEESADAASQADTLPEDATATRRGAEDADIRGGDLRADPLAGVDTVFYFDFDKSLLKPEARAVLTIHAKQLRQNPRNVRLEGHADERGTREYNLALGERRANSVKEFLVLQGVDGSYIEVISYGEERPASLGGDEQSLSLNRRVELK